MYLVVPYCMYLISRLPTPLEWKFLPPCMQVYFNSSYFRLGLIFFRVRAFAIVLESLFQSKTKFCNSYAWMALCNSSYDLKRSPAFIFVAWKLIALISYLIIVFFKVSKFNHSILLNKYYSHKYIRAGVPNFYIFCVKTRVWNVQVSFTSFCSQKWIN